MLGKKKKGAKRRGARHSVTVLAHGTRVEGRLMADTDVVIEGYLEGRVESSSLVTVSAPGLVRGDVASDGVTIGGRVEGTVSAKDTLHMLEGGCIAGDACYGVLQVDLGGEIEGRTTKLSPDGSDDDSATQEISPADDVFLGESPIFGLESQEEPREEPAVRPSAPPPPPPPIPLGGLDASPPDSAESDDKGRKRQSTNPGGLIGRDDSEDSE